VIKLKDIKIDDTVFIITHDKNNLTVIHKATVTGFQDDHCICQLNTDDMLKVSKFRRESQIFLTREEAQAEHDQLTSYLNYRMSGHKMK